jgi:hypothetical protein
LDVLNFTTENSHSFSISLYSQDTVDRLQQEEDARNQLFQQKKKLEQENGGLKKDIEDLELAIQKVRRIEKNL